jgi:hypothetical protein
MSKAAKCGIGVSGAGVAAENCHLPAVAMPLLRGIGCATAVCVVLALRAYVFSRAA